ncbi:MAG: ATP-binding protein [Bacteroidales bacterium]|nr:ATP-binding protein [Bacteroidales bacterium]
MVKKIAITGPESTGKSTLASDLAEHYKTVWVPEYAREYLEKINRSYEFDDISIIAKEQKKLENQYIDRAKDLLFCDTELLVTKIWSEYKYGNCDHWILNELKNPGYDLYLLTDIDIPWEYDPQRENPTERKELFDRYYNELIQMKFPFKIINGTREIRLQNAIHYIDQLVLK